MERGNWFAPQYKPDQARAWHLSILVSNEVCAWAVHALDNGEVLAISWSTGTTALDAEELPTHPATVSLVTLPEWSTLVPEGALEPGTEARHLGLVHGGLPTGALRDEPLASLGATCIYVHDDMLESAVLDRYPNARPVPMQGLMVRAAQARANGGPVALLHRGHQRVDITVANGSRVLLSNTYPAQTSQDLLYYTLLAAEGCALKPSDMAIHHGGTHLTAHEQDLLRRYFAVERSALEPWPHAKDAAEEPARWLALLEQFACVS